MYIEHQWRDSIFLHDSIYIREGVDTVYMTHIKTVFRDRLKTDTLIKCDTFCTERIVYTETPAKEKKRDYSVILLVLLLLYFMCRSGILKRCLNLLKNYFNVF